MIAGKPFLEKRFSRTLSKKLSNKKIKKRDSALAIPLLSLAGTGVLDGPFFINEFFSG